MNEEVSESGIEKFSDGEQSRALNAVREEGRIGRGVVAVRTRPAIARGEQLLFGEFISLYPSMDGEPERRVVTDIERRC